MDGLASNDRSREGILKILAKRIRVALISTRANCAKYLLLRSSAAVSVIFTTKRRKFAMVRRGTWRFLRVWEIHELGIAF